MPKTALVLLIFSTLVHAETYDCNLIYDGSDKVSAHGVFSMTNGYLNLDMKVPGPDYRAVASIAKNVDGSIDITIGDFCGEHFQETNLFKMGSRFHTKYSYGREPNTENWRTLELNCARR